MSEKNFFCCADCYKKHNGLGPDDSIVDLPLGDHDGGEK